MTQQGPDAFRGLVNGDEIVVEFGEHAGSAVQGTTRLVLPPKLLRTVMFCGFTDHVN